MRVTSSALTILLTATCLTTPAFAWDPNAGAEDMPVARYQPSNPYTASPALQRVYPRAAAMPAYTAPAAPQPAVIAPPAANAYAAAPAATPAYAPPPAPVAAPIARAPYTSPAYTYASQPAYRANSYSVGVEGYWDRYREDIASLESNSGYGALDLGWEHHYSPNWFSRTELRGGYGREDYKSISGSLDGTDQWEFDGRLLAGYDQSTGNGGHIKPYLGLDARYYRDEGKGGVTSLGFNAYDRRIFQLMLPVGVTYDIPTGRGFHFLPTIEGGPLLYGNVSTRLENIPGYSQLENHQGSGYEVRGDFMLNDLDDAGRGLEFGPFVRYFHMEDSGTDTIPAGTFIEPKNSRLQLGAKMDYKF